MANNTRDVRMTLAVDTVGEQGIKELQASVQKLAKEGGAAAPEFQKLADEIARIGEQAAAVRAVEALTQQTGALAQRQELAATAARDLRAQLDALSAVTVAATERQRANAAALTAARDAQFATSQALKTLSAETDRAGKSEAAYINEKRRLTLESINQAKTINELTRAMSSSAAEVKQAAAAEAALAAAHQRAATAAAAATAALQANQSAVSGARVQMTELGIVSDTTAAAQLEVVAGLNAAGAAANRLRADVDSLAQRERELADLHVFQKQAAEASALVRATEYLDFFERELAKVAAQERDLLKIRADQQWQRDAEALVNAAHAAQKLAHEAKVLQEAQRQLAAQKAFEKAANDAMQLVRAGDYARNFREQLELAERQARETAEAAATAAKKIASAFQTIGVRSAQDLEAEIARVRAAMRTVEQQAGVTGAQIRSAFDAGNQRIADLQRQLRGVNGELTRADQLAGLFSNSIAQISAGNIIANGFGFLIQKVKDLVVAFVETIVQTQNLKRALTSVYQDTTIAGQQFAFLKKTANDAGVSVGGIQQSFVKFSAATKASGIGLETTNALFQAVTRSAGILGLSGEQVAGTLEALSQMASKGTVSMEELRQQLGDRLPGALSLVSKGLGITDAQLIKLVESGGLAARDLFPALTNALGEMSGEANGLSNSFQRFKNMFSEVAESTGEAVWTDVLTQGLKALAVVAAALLLPFNLLSTILGVIGRGIGILVASIATLSNPLGALSEMVSEQTKRYDKLNNSIIATVTGTKSASVAAAEHTTKMEEAGVAAAEEALQVATTNKAIEAQALAQKLAADKTLDRSSALVQLKVAIDTFLAAQSAQIDADVKMAKAAKIQGDSLVDLAKIRGNHVDIMQTQIAASDRYADAMNRAAESQKAETELLIIKRDEIVKTALAQDKNTTQRRVEIEAIEKKIIASKAETEQAAAAAAAARQETDARRLAAKTYEDNSARLDEFRKALEAATAAQAAAVVNERDGYGTKEQLAEATRRVTDATVLYNDAIKDTIASLDLQNRVQQANMNLKLTTLQIEQRTLESMAAQRKAVGDFAGALFYEIEARRKQIEAIKLTSAAKKLEAEATIKALEIERAALDQNDPMLKAKQAEIDIRLANAKAKLLEANAGKTAIEALEREITALRKNNEERQKGREHIDKDTVSREKNAEAITKQTQAMAAQKGASGTPGGAQYDENGMALNTKGEVVSASTAPAPWRGASDWHYTDKDGNWRKSSKQPVPDPEGNWMEPGSKSGFGTGTAERDPSLGGWAKGIGSSAAPAPAAPAATAGTGGTTQTININLGGKQTAVNVASEEDARALTAVLRQLETSAGAAA